MNKGSLETFLLSSVGTRGPLSAVSSYPFGLNPGRPATAPSVHSPPPGPAPAFQCICAAHLRKLFPASPPLTAPGQLPGGQGGWSCLGWPRKKLRQGGAGNRLSSQQTLVLLEPGSCRMKGIRICHLKKNKYAT